jgi:cyclophilin family peptidyl-prolyl cis-trans isomerase
MCNKGYPHSNGSSFYITLGRLEAFDRKNVAFGRVVQGLNILKKVTNQIQLLEQAPQLTVQIIDSGIYSYQR